MQLLHGSFPPQIRTFYPPKSLFALNLAFATQNAFPESSEVLPPAPKATPRTRSGPGGAVGVFWHGFAWNDSVFQGWAPEGFGRGGKQQQREGRALLCVPKSINLPKDGCVVGGCSSLMFWWCGFKSLRLHKGQRGACAGDFNLHPKGVIYPWETKGEKFLHSLGQQRVHSALQKMRKFLPKNKKERIKELHGTDPCWDWKPTKSKIFNRNKKQGSVQHWNLSQQSVLESSRSFLFSFFPPKDLQCEPKPNNPTTKSCFAQIDSPELPQKVGLRTKPGHFKS